MYFNEADGKTVSGVGELAAGLLSLGRVNGLLWSPPPHRATAAPQREGPGAGAGVERPGEPPLGVPGPEEVPRG